MRPVRRNAERYGVAGAQSLSPRVSLDLRARVRDLSSRSVSGECSPSGLPPPLGDMVAPARLGRRAALCAASARDSTTPTPNNTPPAQKRQQHGPPRAERPASTLGFPKKRREIRIISDE
jgi:hypothetical protein